MNIGDIERVTYKRSLVENLMNALKVIDKLGLRGTKPVEVGGVKVSPRDVVAACAPQPKDIGNEMVGELCVVYIVKELKRQKKKK